MIGPILARRNAASFWLAVVATGLGTGVAAAALTLLLGWVQHILWGGGGLDLLQAAQASTPTHHLNVLFAAGVLVGVMQLLLTRLTSGNSIDITEAIWFHAGRVPALRTLASAVLSVIIVAMGAALGREGAPKQAGAVLANTAASGARLNDEQRRLLVACGAGAGMAAAYGVPVGGALFALEVLRGTLALRFVLPALVTSLTATSVSWIFLPNRPVYDIPAYAGTASACLWAALAGPVIGVISVLYVRGVSLADRNRPSGWRRLLAPVLALGTLGLVSIPFPQLLGNGRDVAALAFNGQIAAGLAAILVLLRPLATLMCLGSGAPGGLFTPSLATGALLGATLGHGCALIWPGVPPSLCAWLGAAAMLSATTQGPVSSVVLMMELCGFSRNAMVPMLLAVATATLLARTLDPRSVYEARLSDAEVLARQAMRDRET